MKIVMRPTSGNTITFLQGRAEITLPAPVEVVAPEGEEPRFLPDSRVVISSNVQIATRVS